MSTETISTQPFDCNPVTPSKWTTIVKEKSQPTKDVEMTEKNIIQTRMRFEHYYVVADGVAFHRPSF
jgi:hypothetical protein